jgi:hypothetical protein
MTGKVETAQNLPRDVLRGILGPMFGGVECDHADRVAVLAGHQIADDGFEIGFADIGFRECRAEVSVIVDDEIKILIAAVRHNRRNKASAIKTPNATYPVEFKHETEASEPQWITADRRCDDVGASASALASA